MSQFRLCLVALAVALLSVTGALGSIPSTCIGGVCYSCPDFCDKMNTNYVGTDQASCTCEGSGPDTLCPNTPCTVVDSGSSNVAVDTIVANGASVSSMASFVLRYCAMMVLIGGVLLHY